MNSLNRTTLPYPYEFEPQEVAGIVACTHSHGFAVVKGIFSEEMLEGLRADVIKVLRAIANSSLSYYYKDPCFIEHSPALAQWLTYEPLMRIAQGLHHNEPITLNRAAAIYKKPGAGVQQWHPEWAMRKHPYKANAVLNDVGGPSLWCYPAGLRPERGGVVLIPGSHQEDWPGPKGYDFTERKVSFYRRGTEPVPCMETDVPGGFTLCSDPGDLVILAERLYRAVYPHEVTESTEDRLLCGMGFRPRSYQFPQIWSATESARRFIEGCPPEIDDIVEGYMGVDTTWVSTPRSI